MAIDFYLDFISPFGYLARARLLDMARRHGQPVHYHPVDIHELRRAAGNTGPSNSRIPAKLAYFTKDYQRWAELYGLPIAKGLPGGMTGVVNRGLFRALDRGEGDAYVEQAWDCIWREGRDPGAEATHAEIERRLGWAAGELAAFADDPATVERYAAETAAASARGVFGVPTFFVGEEMWWGNDRLDFIDRHLASPNATHEAH